MNPHLQLSSIHKIDSHYTAITPVSPLSSCTNINSINYVKQATPRNNIEYKMRNTISRGFVSAVQAMPTESKNNFLFKSSIIPKHNNYNNFPNIIYPQHQPSNAEIIRTPPNEIQKSLKETYDTKIDNERNKKNIFVNKSIIESSGELNMMSNKSQTNSNFKSIIREESLSQISRISIEQESLIHRTKLNKFNEKSILELLNRNEKKNDHSNSNSQLKNPLTDLETLKHLAHIENQQVIRSKKNLFGKFQVKDEDMLEDRLNFSDKSLYLFSRTNKLRLFLFRLAESQYFDFFIIFIIIFNSVVLAFALSLDLITTGFDFMDVLEYIFVFIYTLESIIKIIAYGFIRGKKAFLKDTWNQLDFLVMINGWVCLFPGMAKYKELKIFRTFRPLRSISFLPGLKNLVQTVIQSMRQFFHLFLLLTFFFILYGVFGISIWSGLLSYRCRETSQPINGEYKVYNNIPKICGGFYQCPGNTTCDSLTHTYDSRKYFLLVDDLYQEQDIPELYYGYTNFDNLGSAFLTIFQSVTLEGWSNIMFIIQNGYNFYTSAFYFISLVIILNYFVINFTVAIMMDSCRSSHIDQDEMQFEERYKNFRVIDQGGDHIIEFNLVTKIRKFLNFFKLLKPFKYVELNSELYSYHKKWKIAYYSYVIINQPIFDFFIYSLIIVNIILLASVRDEDNYYYNSNDDLLTPSEIFNYVLVSLFCIESILKFISNGFLGFFRQKNNLFDMIILFLSIYEILILNKATLAILRVLRIYRLFKLMTKWKTIAIILKCLHATIKEMGYYVLLLFIMIYVFSLIGMNFFKGTLKFDPVNNKYSNQGKIPKVNFENMYQSMVAVFVLITGDNWTDVMFMCLRSPKTSKVVVYVFFITVIVFLNIIMLNLVIAFLVYIFENSRKKFQFQDRNRQINEYLKARKIKNSMSFSYFPDFELRGMIKPLNEGDYNELDNFLEKEKMSKIKHNNISPKSFVKKKNDNKSMFKKSPLKSPLKRRSTQLIFDYSKAGLSEKKQIRDSNTDKLLNLEPILFETLDEVEENSEKNEFLKNNGNQLDNINSNHNNEDIHNLSGLCSMSLSRKILQRSLKNFKQKRNLLKKASTSISRKSHTVTPAIEVKIPGNPDILRARKTKLYINDGLILRDEFEKNLNRQPTFNVNINMNMNINLNMNMNMDMEVSPTSMSNIPKNKLLNKLSRGHTTSNNKSNYKNNAIHKAFRNIEEIDKDHISNDSDINISQDESTNKKSFNIIELKKVEVMNNSASEENVLTKSYRNNNSLKNDDNVEVENNFTEKAIENENESKNTNFKSSTKVNNLIKSKIYTGTDLNLFTYYSDNMNSNKEVGKNINFSKERKVNTLSSNNKKISLDNIHTIHSLDSNADFNESCDFNKNNFKNNYLKNSSKNALINADINIIPKKIFNPTTATTINLSDNLKEEIKEEIKSIIQNTIQSMRSNTNPANSVNQANPLNSDNKTPQKSNLKSHNSNEVSFQSQHIENDCEANKKRVRFKDIKTFTEEKERRCTVKDKPEGKISRAKTIISHKASFKNTIIHFISNASLLIFHKDWKIRRLLVIFVNSGWFESVASICIVLSNIVLLLDTSYIDPTSTYAQVLSTMDSVFTFIFFVEMLMKIIAFGLLFDHVTTINSAFDELKGGQKEDTFDREEKRMNDMIEMRKNMVKMERKSSRMNFPKVLSGEINTCDNNLNHNTNLYNKEQNFTSGMVNNYVNHNHIHNRNVKMSINTEGVLSTLNTNPLNNTITRQQMKLANKATFVNLNEIFSSNLNENKDKEANSNNRKFSKKRLPNSKKLQANNSSTGAGNEVINLGTTNTNNNLCFLDDIPDHFWQRAYLRNLFNVIDSFVIIISLIDFFSADSIFEVAKQMKTLRVLRALRPLRMINRFTELRLVVKCLIDSIPAIANMLMIGSFVFFVYAVIGLNLFHGHLGTCSLNQFIYSSDCRLNNGTWKASNVNFDNISSSMLTVFEMATTSNWYEVMYNVVEKTNRYSSIYFVSFMLIGAIFVMNLSVTVIVDNFVTLNEAEEGITMISEEQKEWVKAMKYFLKYKPVPCYKTRNFSKFRKICFNIVNHSNFNKIINIMILINVLIMCMRYDRDGIFLEDIQSYISYFFSSLFTLELIMKLVVYRKLYFIDVWNKFDFIVVIISNCSVILSIVRYYIGDFGENSFLTVMIRIVRILRVFRLLKINEFVKNYFYTLLFLFPSLINIGSLVLVILTVYSILGMNLFGTVKFGDIINSNNNFKDFLNSMIFLIRTTTGDSWNDSMHELATNQPNCRDQSYQELILEGPQGCGSPYAYFYFVSFMITNSMVIMNLFIAVVVESLIRDTEKYDAVDAEEIKAFFELWGKYDPEVRYVIDPQEFVLLMMELPSPLGINGDKIFEKELSQKFLHGNIHVSYDNNYYADDKQCIKILTKLKIEARNEKIHIIDAIKCVTKRAVIADREDPDTTKEYEQKFCKLDEIKHERFNRKLNQKFAEYDGFYCEQVEKKMSNFVVASKVIGKFLIRWRRRRLERLKAKGDN
jgi:hypothetical protein